MSRTPWLTLHGCRLRALPYLTAACLAALSPPLRAAGTFLSATDQLQVGQWLEVHGALAADGSFVGESAELQQPQAKDLLIGTVPVTELDPRRFTLLGCPVITNEKTRWRGLAPTAIGGARVKVEGLSDASGALFASSVTARGAGRDRVGSRVNELRPAANRSVDAVPKADAAVPDQPGPFARMICLDVQLPAEMEHNEALTAIANAPPRALDQFGFTRGSEDVFGKGIALGSSARLSSMLELSGSTEQDFDLDPTNNADRLLLRPSARVRIDWSPPESRLSGALALRAEDKRTYTNKADSVVNTYRISEAYLALDGAVGAGSTLFLGRQDFDDAREWIYKKNLDAARLLLTRPGLRFELSASTTISGGSPRDESSSNYIAVLSNDDRRRQLSAWVMQREFDLPTHERSTHAGLRAVGKWLPASDSWLEVATFRGQRGPVALEGWAYDAGSTFRPKWTGPFSFTLGYAYGSGGKLSADKDQTFRQTGFQNNNDKFAGVTSFHYYGELLDPELANLRISTLGLGMRFAKHSSIDLVWHGYEQDSARRHLISTQLDRRADGIHRNLGWEADLVLGVREREQVDIEFVAAYFNPGAAFADNAKGAFMGKIQLRFRF